MSSGFVTETEVLEARKKRQEEWEKVRAPDQPLERPEEPYDSRCLYDRLKEQKMKKDLDYEEAHKLKNLIRGLDDDEVEFLDLVDQTKMKAEKQQLIEERKELNDFRQRVATLQEKSFDDKIQSEKSAKKTKVTPITNRPSQKSILSGLVRKRKNGEIETGSPPPKKSQTVEENVVVPPSETIAPTTQTILGECHETIDKGVLKCVAILPGIGRYKESSDSEMSTDSEENFDEIGKYDLVGRQNLRTKRKCESTE